MLGASIFRSNSQPRDAAQHHVPGPVGRHLNPVLLSFSRRACVHPIYTIVSVAILASTTYLGLLESSLFDRRISVNNAVGRVDLNNLLSGSRNLYAGPETSWKWSAEQAQLSRPVDDVGSLHQGLCPLIQLLTSPLLQNIALVTLVFPDSATSSAAPHPHSVHIPSNLSAKLLPCSANRLAQISYDSTLAFSVPFSEAPKFLTAFQELPVSGDASETRYDEQEGSNEEKKWIMRAVKHPGSASIVGWISESWSEFLDLIKNAESLDIVIMVLGYLAMHLTFVSLFLSMRRLGSNFWLAASVLLSSSFAFLFGLITTTKLGVPLNMVLLSEGLPFLVVTVGFEKPIILTKAVLAASLDKKTRWSTDSPPHDAFGSLPTIQEAVTTAVKVHGLAIVRDYGIEILILVAGASSGVQGGLRQFCFLGAWILFFDCVLLFTFYTAILTVKLEINRIKRHVALRKALEDDGVSRRVAENVASSNDWPRMASDDGNVSNENPVFGHKVGERAIPKFKVLMVGGFVVVNLLNFATIPFRNASSAGVSPFSSIVSQPPMDPFKVAGNGLETILSNAQVRSQSVLVTILAPIKYELQYPSIHYAPTAHSQPGHRRDESPLFDGMGSTVVQGVLKSFEDPVLSKWIVVALAMSLVLNGYLFNAARWTIKTPVQPDQPPRAEEVLDQPGPGRIPGQVNPPHSDLAPAPREPTANDPEPEELPKANRETRSFDECLALLREKKVTLLTDEELVTLSLKGKIPGYALEKTLGDMTRAVKIRRMVVSRTHATRDTSPFLEHSNLPYMHYDYERVYGACWYVTCYKKPPFAEY
jgi:hydroxymethylglutaryl-CoA reductase (NADPH)